MILTPETPIYAIVGRDTEHILSIYSDRFDANMMVRDYRGDRTDPPLDCFVKEITLAELADKAGITETDCCCGGCDSYDAPLEVAPRERTDVEKAVVGFIDQLLDAQTKRTEEVFRAVMAKERSK